jgi:hypothetical protein
MHHLTTDLVARFDVNAIEDLNVAEMLKTILPSGRLPRRALANSDVSWNSNRYSA